MHFPNYFRLNATVDAACNTAKTATEDSSQAQTVKLIYRGTVYEVPQNQLHNPAPTVERAVQLMRQHLYYRGETYKMTAIAAPKQPRSFRGQRLLYRGAAYTV